GAKFHAQSLFARHQTSLSLVACRDPDQETGTYPQDHRQVAAQFLVYIFEVEVRARRIQTGTIMNWYSATASRSRTGSTKAFWPLRSAPKCPARSEERRVGKGSRSRWSPYHYKTNGYSRSRPA